MVLYKVEEKDLIFSDEYNKISTQFIAENYNWNEYRLITKVMTHKNGILKIIFRNNLSDTSEMYVKQLVKGEYYFHLYNFENRIANKNMLKFIELYKQQLEGKNKDIEVQNFVIGFFNEVLERGNLQGVKIIKETPKNLTWFLDDDKECIKINKEIKKGA